MTSVYPILQSIGELEKLEAILEIQDGNHGEKHPVSADYIESGIPFIMAKDFSDGTVNIHDCKFLRKEHADSLRVGFAKKDDVLLTHKGTVGNVAIVPSIKYYLMLTPQVTYYRLEPSKLNNKYFMYALREPGFQDRMKSVSSQSTRPYVGITAQRDLRVLIHPLPTQRKIAAILSAYDDLIENNLRRIKVLEEMAQNLYREWFVKFRFPACAEASAGRPGHQQARFIDFPHGRIPEGWEVVSVEEIVKRVPSGKKYDQKTVNATGTVPVLDQGRSGVIGYHDDEPGVLASEDAPIIVFANHTCYQRLVMFTFSAIQNVLPFVPSSEYPRNIYWLHYATKDLVKFNDYKGHWPEFMAKELILPLSDICQQFGGFVEPITRLIFKMEKRNEALRHTRDLLLPRLISGEVDVSELDIAVPMGATL